MDGYNSKMSIWHGLLRKTPLKVNEISYNHHFPMNDDWPNVPNMVSDGDSNVDLMLIGLKIKNAISQLLIKLETCGFQYLQ